MANDNILAGTASFAEGVNSVLTPWMQGNIRKDQELDAYKQRIPLQQEAELGIHEKKLGLERESQKLTLPFQTDEKIRFEEGKPGKKRKEFITRANFDKRVKAGDTLHTDEFEIVEATTRDSESLKSERKKQGAKDRLQVELSKMLGHYKKLKTSGGIKTTESTPLEALGDAAQTSTVGQFTGNVFSTENQSTRNKINQMRPLVIQEIRQATDMSARGLDSEKELEFYMQATSDTTKDFEANLDAIVALDRIYGNGKIADQIEAEFGVDGSATQSEYEKTKTSSGGENIHSQALEWANANPNDPRSKSIIEKANLSTRRP